MHFILFIFSSRNLTPQTIGWCLWPAIAVANTAAIAVTTAVRGHLTDSIRRE